MGGGVAVVGEPERRDATGVQMEDILGRDLELHRCQGIRVWEMGCVYVSVCAYVCGVIHRPGSGIHS